MNGAERGGWRQEASGRPAAVGRGRAPICLSCCQGSAAQKPAEAAKRRILERTGASAARPLSRRRLPKGTSEARAAEAVQLKRHTSPRSVVPHRRRRFVEPSKGGRPASRLRMSKTCKAEKQREPKSRAGGAEGSRVRSPVTSTAVEPSELKWTAGLLMVCRPLRGNGVDWNAYLALCGPAMAPPKTAISSNWRIGDTDAMNR